MKMRENCSRCGRHAKLDSEGICKQCQRELEQERETGQEGER